MVRPIVCRGRARDNRLVHVALPEGLAEADRPRPGDMIRATVTYGAPHHLIADSGAQGGLSRCAVRAPVTCGRPVRRRRNLTLLSRLVFRRYAGCLALTLVL